VGLLEPRDEFGGGRIGVARKDKISDGEKKEGDGLGARADEVINGKNKRKEPETLKRFGGGER